jgi:hypothetical protein
MIPRMDFYRPVGRVLPLPPLPEKCSKQRAILEDGPQNITSKRVTGKILYRGIYLTPPATIGCGLLERRKGEQKA